MLQSCVSNHVTMESLDNDTQMSVQRDAIANRKQVHFQYLLGQGRMSGLKLKACIANCRGRLNGQEITQSAEISKNSETFVIKLLCQSYGSNKKTQTGKCTSRTKGGGQGSGRTKNTKSDFFQQLAHLKNTGAGTQGLRWWEVMFLGELFSIAWWLFHPICCEDWIYVACSEKGMLRAGGRALSKITKVGRSPLALDFKVHTFFDK